jgi:hypothetical protein
MENSNEPAEDAPGPVHVRSLLSAASASNAERSDQDQVSPPAHGDLIDFALGTNDVVMTICATLIGLGVLPAETFMADLRRNAVAVRAVNPTRATAIELVLLRLEKVARDKREAIAHVVHPAALPKGVN